METGCTTPGLLSTCFAGLPVSPRRAQLGFLLIVLTFLLVGEAWQTPWWFCLPAYPRTARQKHLPGSEHALSKQFGTACQPRVILRAGKSPALTPQASRGVKRIPSHLLGTHHT